jgi:hypothetical protein
MKNKKLKLTQSDKKRMWGEECPYSETHIKTQSRILGAYVSRIFLVVEAHINPFTFEYVAKNLDYFPANHPVRELIKNALYEGGDYGYVVQAGQEEFVDQRSLKLAHEYLKTLTSIVIEMHEFVIARYGLKRVVNQVYSRDIVSESSKKKRVGKDFDILEENSGVLYHSILPWNGKDVSDEEIEKILSTFCDFAKKKSMNIVDLEYAIEYLRITFAMPADIVEAEKNMLEFIDIINKSLISKNNADRHNYFRKPLLKATERPSFREISAFLKSL